MPEWFSVTFDELLASDGIYVFTPQHPESFAIPIEAQGGVAFWAKPRDLGLFPHELAITAATLPEGASVCWPP